MYWIYLGSSQSEVFPSRFAMLNLDFMAMIPCQIPHVGRNSGLPGLPGVGMIPSLALAPRLEPLQEKDPGMMALTRLEEMGNLSQEAGENCRGTGTPQTFSIWQCWKMISCRPVLFDFIFGYAMAGEDPEISQIVTYSKFVAGSLDLCWFSSLSSVC